MTQMQLPLSPADSMKHYSTPQGFRLELFASEVDFAGKPIAMNWDERGRLWICETLDYPNELQPRGKGRDRIRLRVWERGAGLTRACGTGACAALVASSRRGLTDRAAVRVDIVYTLLHRLGLSHKNNTAGQRAGAS